VREGGANDKSGRKFTKTGFFERDLNVVLRRTWEQKRESLSVKTLTSYIFRPFNLTGTRYAATSPRCPAYLLANSLCSLASLLHVLLTDPKIPHQHVRRTPTERSMPPYESEPQFRAHESRIEVPRSQTTLCYPWKSLCVPHTRIQSTPPPTAPSADHPRRQLRPPLTTLTAGHQPPPSPTVRPPQQFPAPGTEAVQRPGRPPTLTPTAVPDLPPLLPLLPPAAAAGRHRHQAPPKRGAASGRRRPPARAATERGATEERAAVARPAAAEQRAAVGGRGAAAQPAAGSGHASS